MHLATKLSRLPVAVAISLFVLLGGGVVMIVAWEILFEGRIYQCSDAIGFPGFLERGNWVHEPIAYVDAVNPVSSMSEPDAILKGWSVGHLWVAWGAMVAMVLVVALLPVFVYLHRGSPGVDDEEGDELQVR